MTYTHIEKTESSQSAHHQKPEGQHSAGFVDNRSATIAQRAIQQRMHNSPIVQSKSIQMVKEEEPVQEMAQAQLVESAVAAGSLPAKKSNNTGLPDNLKSGIESLSGMSMDHVKVHYNSEKPAQLQAHAYAQGSDIHVAPGQEKHLPHEAWHVVQQAQGRVKPTMQMKGDVSVNDDAGLEHEADVMGGKALQLNNFSATQAKMITHSTDVVQRVVPDTQQPTGNTCWAACGFAIHQHFGGVDADIQTFVTNSCSAASAARFTNDQVNDIDEVIGSLSNQNLLTGSDSAGTYGKSGITQKLNNNTPIVANVNGNHYIILTARTIQNGVYSVTYMDPAVGQSVTEDAVEDVNSPKKITHVGAYALTALYYT